MRLKMIKYISINNIICMLDNENLNKYFEDIDFDNNKRSKVNNFDLSCSCGSTKNIEDYSLGFIVCSQCGQVLENVMDRSPEWKQYDDEERSNGRCGTFTNKLLPQSSLGISIAGNYRSKLNQMNNWTSMIYKERSLSFVFKIIQEKCQHGKILKCIEDDAKIMYKMISECKHINGKNEGKYVITRGINRTSIIAACVFYACKRKNMSRTTKDIANLFGIKQIDMNKGCKNFLKLIKNKNLDMDMGSSKAEHFVMKKCREMNIKTIFTDQAIFISQNISKLNLASVHTPYSLAAASILIMSELNNLHTINKKTISKFFGISEITIMKTYKKLEDYKHILNNNDMINKILNKKSEVVQRKTIPNCVLERMKKYGIQINENKFDIDFEFKKILENKKEINVMLFNTKFI
jgi:transcription initiation factor TFIIIB Brf1 subunit/transcription initiation factor TFIIB